jgi:hypothetical protein
VRAVFSGQAQVVQTWLELGLVVMDTLEFLVGFLMRWQGFCHERQE